MILSDLGAEVVKIEKPTTGDETRAWGPPFVKGMSGYFLSLNRGKKSITLNLKTREAQKIVRQLARDADVFVESFRPGTIARFKLDYSSLRRVNTALVYCSISGFGQTGPYRDRPSYDIIALAMSGIMSTTGEEGRPPVRVSVPVADIAAGHYAVTAILAAVARRLVKGVGDYIDVSLLDSIVSWLTYNATNYLAAGIQSPRMGSAHPSIVPYQAFRCRDRDLIVAIGNDRQWKAFCEAVGLEDLAEDARFRTNPLRVRNRNVLVPKISRIFRRQKANYWHKLLLGRKVPATPVHTIRDVVEDPHVRSRKMIVERRGLAHLAFPVKFRKASADRSSPAPRLGEHTSRILRELRYSREAIGRLKQSGAIG
jgi:crotonobetainyl-CoA:carnitine CoA-transferase CaiB-like acyl-CoA transferase